LYAAGTAASVASSVGLGGAASGAAPDSARGAQAATTPIDYFVDVMFRPGPGGAAATAQSSPGETVGVSPQPAMLSADTRAEVTRIAARSISQGRLDDNDRAYLAQVVAARTGLSQEEAQRRVAEVESKAREAVKEAADKTAKAGAYFSFWTFM